MTDNKPGLGFFGELLTGMVMIVVAIFSVVFGDAVFGKRKP